MFSTTVVVSVFAIFASVPLKADVAAPTAPTPTETRPTESFPSPAHAALAYGHPRRALEILDSRVSRLTPAERHAIAGRARLALGEFTAARRELTSATRMRPNRAEDQYWLGRALLAGGSPTLAAARFKKANWRGLDNAELHRYWAIALRDAGQRLGRIVRRTLPKNTNTPPEPGTFAFGGIVLGSIPRRPETVAVSPPNSAIYHAYRALQLDPTGADALLLCAEIWAHANRHEEAVACYARAADRLGNADLVRCHEGWAESLLALGEFDDCLKHAKQAMKLDGGIESGKLARCYDRTADRAARRGEAARQIRYLKLAAELQPDPERLIALSDALAESNQYVEAVTYLRNALDQQPSAYQQVTIQQRLSLATYLASPR